MGKDNKSYLRHGIIVIIFSWLLVILTPVPFLSNLLMGEEGMFAYLAVDNGKTEFNDTSKILLIGREKGIDKWDAPRHPILPYMFLSHVIRPFTGGINFSHLNFHDKTVMARTPFYSFYALAMLLVLLLNLNGLKKMSIKELLIPLGLLAFIGTSGLMVGGAVQTLYDGNLGVLLIGTSAFLLIWGFRVQHKMLMYTLWFSGGWVAAMGKNEWAMAFGSALFLLWAFKKIIGLIRNHDNGDETSKIKPLGKIPVWGLLGVISGSLFHYLMDPYNYVKGFEVIYQFGIKSPLNWMDTFVARLPWIWPFFLMIPAAFIILIRNGRKLLINHLPGILVMFWGVLIFFGFLITRHGGDGFPRYFGPAMMALLIYFLDVWGTLHKKWNKGAIAIGILLFGLVLFNIYGLCCGYAKHISIGSIPGCYQKEHRHMFIQQYMDFRRTGNVQKTDSAAAYYFPDMDFINNT